jgi:hypothetical protein
MNPPPPMPPVKKSNYKPILLTLLFLFLLAGGSCFGFLTTTNSLEDTKVKDFFADCFVICVLVFLGALLWLLAKAIRSGNQGSGGAQ